MLTLIISSLALHTWLFIEIELNEFVLTKPDENNDPMKNHFLINLNILYIMYNIIFPH